MRISDWSSDVCSSDLARIVDSLVRDLRRRGIALRDEARVVGVDPAAGAVTLADGTREQAEAIVVAAGAWTAKLFPELQRRAVPHRQVVAYMEPPAAHAESWARAQVMVHLLRSEEHTSELQSLMTI